MQLLVVETRLCASATVYSLYVNTLYKNVTVCSFEAVTSASCMSTASVRTEKFMWHDASQQAGAPGDGEVAALHTLRLFFCLSFNGSFTVRTF